MSKRSSKFDDIDKLKQAVSDSRSLAGVLRRMNLNIYGSNYDSLKSKIKELSLDTAHFTGKGHCKFIPNNKIPMNEILVENSTYKNRTALKKRLVKEGYLKYVCSKCGLTSKWQGKELVLILDHINGVNNDHRINNLRFLCPNCNSQTSTFAGRNVKNLPKWWK